jgi:hypothetical protein
LYMSIAFKVLKCFTIFLRRCMTFCAINFPSLPQTQQNPTLNWFMYSSVHFSCSRTSKKLVAVDKIYKIIFLPLYQSESTNLAPTFLINSYGDHG